MNKIRNHFGWILCIVFIIVFCCSCNKTYSKFSTELTEILSEQYGISIPVSAKFISAEYKDFAERDPSLTVIFDVSNEDLQGIFKYEMWDETDVEASLQSEIGIDTSIHWEFDATNSGTHFYNAEMHIEKISEDSFRISFCGFGVNTKFFNNGTD